MKRALALILAALILMPSALAEIDLSGMTLEELIQLNKQISITIFQRAKSVTVPQGVWIIGEDIPAGKYTVRCYESTEDRYNLSSCHLSWGKSEPHNGYFDYGETLGYVWLYNPKNSRYDEWLTTEYEITLEAGTYLYIDPDYNRAVFYQYTGKPNLGFDW